MRFPSVFACGVATLISLTFAGTSLARSIAPNAKPLATFSSFTAGGYPNTPFDAIRYEVGFAMPWTPGSTNSPMYLTSPLFGEQRVTSEDDGISFIATQAHTPGFGDFTDALLHRDAGTMRTRLTLLRDGQPDQLNSRLNLSARGADGHSLLPNTFTPDLSMYHITAVELVISKIDFVPAAEIIPSLEGRGLYGFRQHHDINIYGHERSPATVAVPTPTAAAAGLALIGLLSSRRRKHTTS